MTKVEQLRDDIQELKSLHESAKRPKVKDILFIEIRKLETEYGAEKERADAIKPSAPVSQSSTKSASRKPYDVQVKTYSWDQSDKFVKIFLTSLGDVKSVSEENISSNFLSHSCTVRVNDINGKNLIFTILETSGEIVPDKSYIKVKSDMIVVYLVKAIIGKWNHLKASDETIPQIKAPSASSEAADPSAGLMSMMKQMYETGDDEMKRSIAKAWSEGQHNKSSMI